MKKGRFLWSAHRITEKQKAGKARNIKEKQLKNSRSTVSRQHVVLLSSPSVNIGVRRLVYTSMSLQKVYRTFRKNFSGRSFWLFVFSYH